MPLCAHSDKYIERMERALPGGPIEVTRCTCGCALWYRSTAHEDILKLQATMTEIAVPPLAEQLLKPNAPQTQRQPGNGRRGRHKFPEGVP